MKVLHLFRGYEDYVIEMLNIQAPAFEVHIGLPMASQWILPHLPSHVRRLTSFAPPIKQLGNVVYLCKLAGYILRVKPDIIHIQSGLIWELLIVFLFRSRCKIVTTVHDVSCHPTQDNTLNMQKWINASIRLAHCIIVHNQDAKNQLNSNQVRIIPHPSFKRYPKLERNRILNKFIFFGGLDKWKGLEILERALHHLKDLNFTLDIRGGSRFKPYYESLFKDHHNVHLGIRRQTDEEVAELFSTGGILILPYIEASQSGVLHLAIHYKIPTIASLVGGIKELVECHHIALGFISQNPVDLAAKMRDLLNNPILGDALIQRQIQYEADFLNDAHLLTLYHQAYLA